MEKNSDNNFLKEIRDRFHDMEFIGKKNMVNLAKQY
jgi:hypothetical protein